mgnify:CR=1 FL=1
MPSHKFPVAIWHDGTGLYTATVLDGTAGEAVAESPTAAVKQLKDLLLWVFSRDPDALPPDMRDPQLAEATVSVRPEYEVDDRPYPCSHRVPMRVPYVHGLRRDGSRVCVLPTLGMSLTAHPSDAVENLIIDYVQRKLHGATPRALARLLPPAELTLDSLVIKATDRTWRQPQRTSALLETVADSLDDRGVRRQYHRALLRDREIAQVCEHLRNSKASLLLVGENGVGKTSILVDAVRMTRRHKANDDSDLVRTSSASHRFWLTSGARLIAGMKFLGQWEERLEWVIEELTQINGVLCADRLAGLLQAGGRDPGASVAAFLAPYMERGDLRLVAEATPGQLDACRQLLPGFADLFHVINIDALDNAAMRGLLNQLAANHERNFGIPAERGCTELLIRLTRRFLPYQVFPGPAVTFLAEAFTEASKYDEPELRKSHIVDRFCQQTGLSENLVRDDQTLAHTVVLDSLRARVVGQDEACNIAASVVTTFKAGLTDPRRPLSVMMFCGPTGVGKTELAKTLSEYLFGHGDGGQRLVRLDMSEYSGFDAARRLLTKPDGEVSDLIERVRREPFSVVLLDEIEKASPAVFDMLLGLFDEGRLTDHFGRTTWFTSTVMIMTSNLGGARSAPIGFDESQTPPFEREVRQFFRPELFNRIDHVVSFAPLRTEHIRSIAEMELRQLRQRKGLLRRNLELSWSEDLLRHLTSVGYDARLGARPLQRAIEQIVVGPLAQWLLQNRQARNQRLNIGWDRSVEHVRITAED